MKVIKFEISSSEVYEKVKKFTHYTAQKAAEDGSQFEHIATIDANEEILSEYLHKGHKALVSAMTRWIVKHNIGTSQPEVASYELNLPDNVDEAQTDVIPQAALDYLVDRVLGGWFGMIGRPEEEKLYLNDGEDAIQVIINAIYSRVRMPRYRMTDHNNNI